MRLLLYIFVLVFLFSCKKQKDSAIDEVATEAYESTDDVGNVSYELESVEETQEKTENELVSLKKEDAVSKNKPKNTTKINTDFIQQQLQETINLIGLKNSADLIDELKADLEKTIDKKVKSTKIDKDLGIVEIKNIQILDSSTNSDDSTQTRLTFEVKTTDNQTKKGKALATISNAFLQVDDVIYTDYQIYFEEIMIQ